MNSIIFKETNSALNEFDFKNVKIINIAFDSDIQNRENGLDDFLSRYVIDKLSDTTYHNILLPLSFGVIKSNYLGLRLAFHIRTSGIVNQCSNIYIYGTERIEGILMNELSRIIFTSGVSLIDYSKSKILESLNNTCEKLNENFLIDELSKTNLSIPKNLYDSHSIANIWAISRWAKIINPEEDDGIDKVNKNVNNNLYFKYLKTIYQSNQLKPIIENKLKIKNKGKVLLIDDEIDKGWGEIFDYLLGVINDLYIDNLGWDFKEKTRGNIILDAMNKIITDNIDVVILDFRLHQEDFKIQNFEEVTGYKLLKEIKKYNPGIQVIVFSATNKIWNLQALQSAGADEFVIKESFENSNDFNFTEITVFRFIKIINSSLERSFLKKIFVQYGIIDSQLIRCEYVDDTPFELFLKDLKNQLKLISIATGNIDLEDSMTLDVVFLNCFNFLEKFKGFYLNLDNNRYVLGIDEIEMNRYSIYKGNIINDGVFLRNNSNDNPSWFHSMAGLFIDYFEVASIQDDLIRNLVRVKDIRNSYIHGNKKYYSKSDLFMIIELCVKMTSCMKE